jgi:chemotaxis protein methyltransferase CheR
MGLHFPSLRWSDLARNLKAAAEEAQALSLEDFARGIVAGPIDKERLLLLARHLTIGETYFFRDPQVFELLERKILPERMAYRRNLGQNKLFLWSAGCSTGEEAYSMAAVAARATATQGFEVQTLATDINEGALDKARKGIYRAWSLRHQPPAFFDSFIRREDANTLIVGEDLKRRVTFEHFNLADMNYPPPMDRNGVADVILCRNVLMYFDIPLLQEIVARLVRRLAPDGWFLVSATETAVIEHPELDGCWEDGVRVFRKRVPGKPSRDSILFTPPPDFLTPEKLPEPSVPPILFTPSAPPPRRVENSKINELAKLDQALTHGRCEEAELLIESSCANLRSAAHLTLLAGLHANCGRLANAEHWYREAIGLDDLNPVAYFELASIIGERGRQNEAAELLRSALFLDNQFILAHFQLSTMLGSTREGQRCLERVIDLLERLPDDAPVPHADGMTVGGMKNTVRRMLTKSNKTQRKGSQA